jgi:hypothetical protein
MPGFEMSSISPGYQDPWLRSLMFLADRTLRFEISHIKFSRYSKENYIIKRFVVETLCARIS